MADTINLAQEPRGVERHNGSRRDYLNVPAFSSIVVDFPVHEDDVWNPDLYLHVGIERFDEASGRWVHSLSARWQGGVISPKTGRPFQPFAGGSLPVGDTRLRPFIEVIDIPDRAARPNAPAPSIRVGAVMHDHVSQA